MAAEIGEINLTVIANAFHWMNRKQTLKDLHRITKPGGGVAIVGDSGPWNGPKPPWKELMDQTVKHWLEMKEKPTGFRKQERSF
jgi:hypothetical protein